MVCYDSNYNNRLIKKIIQKNEEKEVIKIFRKTVREMWIIYKTDDINNEFPGFNTIKYDIKKFRERNESEDYIRLYSSVCNEFEDIFMKIKARKKTKNLKGINKRLKNNVIFILLIISITHV